MLATIDLYVLLDNPARTALIANPASRFGATTPEFVLRDTTRLRVRFYRREDPASSVFTQVDLGVDAAVAFAGKALATYVASSDFLFYGDLVRTDDGTEETPDLNWQATLNLNTEEFIDAFGSASEVGLKCEVQVTQDADVRTVAQFSAQGIFDVIRGDEVPPTPSVPPYPITPTAGCFFAASTDGLLWVQLTPAEAMDRLGLRALTGLTGGSAGDLDALPTAAGAILDRTVREVLIGSVAGGDLSISRWVLMPGTNAEDGVSYIRPDDYNASTNARIWVRIG